MAAQQLTRWYAFWARMADVRRVYAPSTAMAHWAAAALDARELHRAYGCWQSCVSVARNRLYIRGEPLDHVLGWTPFFSNTIRVRRPLLIPRTDTETWLAALLSLWQPKWRRVVDLCTGTGCIAAAIAAHLNKSRGSMCDMTDYHNNHYIFSANTNCSATAQTLETVLSDFSNKSKVGNSETKSYSHVTAIDNSARACTMAKLNTKCHGVNVSVLRADIMDPDFVLPPCDIVISNPPYIARQRMLGIAPSVRMFEDIRATVASSEMVFYRRIIDLAAGTPVAVELDGTRAHARGVLAYAQSQGYTSHTPFRDTSNRVRALLMESIRGTNGNYLADP